MELSLKCVLGRPTIKSNGLFYSKLFAWMVMLLNGVNKWHPSFSGSLGFKVNDDIGHYFKTHKGLRLGDLMLPGQISFISWLICWLYSWQGINRTAMLGNSFRMWCTPVCWWHSDIYGAWSLEIYEYETNYLFFWTTGGCQNEHSQEWSLLFWQG